MSTEQWLYQLLLGAILGMMGQGLRIIVGIKKLSDQASQQNKQVGELFHASSLGISLLIGFIAGAIASISINSGTTPVNFTQQAILGLMAAGYAGTDFIEGFVKKYLPS